MTFSAAEIAALAATQELWMLDACKIGVYSSGVDSAGGPTSTYTYGAEIACGVDIHLGSRALNRYYDSDGTFWVGGAVVRLPLGTAIDAADRIRITKRWGTAVTNVDYYLMGEPMVGPSCIMCNVRTVTT